MIVIVDSNILFASLRSKNSKFRTILFKSEYSFYTPNFLIVEIFRHKERILKKAKTSEIEAYEFLTKALRRAQFISEEMITRENIEKAYKLCKDIDEKDTPFVALALEMDASLWTRDKDLIEGLTKKGFYNFFEKPKII